MASTFTSLHYHLVFATKHREPWFALEMRSRIHEYLGGSIRGIGGVAHIVGGVSDHVHLLVGLKPTHCLADVMREMKKASSIWIRNELNLAEFAWQEGYAAFTVSAANQDAVRKYIANQEEHHRKVGFREELIGFLKKAGIPFEDCYLD